MYQCRDRLILASGSPRRRELLAGCGLSFEVIVPGSSEQPLPKESPEAMVKRLALLKAKEVSTREPQAWVMGADTDVFIDGEILGKPRDEQDAERMLKKIQGRIHVVWGGFAIVQAARQIEHVEAYQSSVEMAAMDNVLIKRYVATREPADKAGAYAVQGIGAGLVSKIVGSYTNVVGLNLAAVLKALRSLGAIEIAPCQNQTS